MSNKKQNIFLALVFVIAGLLAFQAFLPKEVQQEKNLGAVSNYLDTEASGMTNTTSTVNTTSTQVFASVSKWSQITNTTASQITCSMDATGITAASSTLNSGRGIIIPATSTGNLAPSVSFGECYPGSVNCYPHKGAVNCLAAAAITIDKIVR